MAQGTWVQTGDRTFNVTSVSFNYDSKGQFTGTTKVRNALTFNDTFDAQSGPAKVDFFDAAGKLMFSVTGSVQATRMRAEPLQ